MLEKEKQNKKQNRRKATTEKIREKEKEKDRKDEKKRRRRTEEEHDTLLYHKRLNPFSFDLSSHFVQVEHQNWKYQSLDHY